MGDHPGDKGPSAWGNPPRPKSADSGDVFSVGGEAERGVWPSVTTSAQESGDAESTRWILEPRVQASQSSETRSGLLKTPIQDALSISKLRDNAEQRGANATEYGIELPLPPRQARPSPRQARPSPRSTARPSLRHHGSVACGAPVVRRAPAALPSPITASTRPQSRLLDPAYFSRVVHSFAADLAGQSMEKAACICWICCCFISPIGCCGGRSDGDDGRRKEVERFEVGSLAITEVPAFCVMSEGRTKDLLGTPTPKALTCS
ncbi:hypothetical protein ON010_g14687 [Phytophthora cinnamomi]|nr:hypothetical protein ON010_g14687 [Phytophthora cinnamomi]